jgi:hypothetical protein
MSVKEPGDIKCKKPSLTARTVSENAVHIHLHGKYIAPYCNQGIHTYIYKAAHAGSKPL